jgi:hypothetical protein
MKMKEIIEKIMVIIFQTIGVICSVLFYIFFSAFLVNWLWNWVVPDLFHLPEITFGQAFALTWLTALLFGRTSYNIKDKVKES